VLVWPTHATVDSALRRWAAENMVLRPDLLRLGCFGSYVRGDWGVGSDLDLVAIVRDSGVPFERRALDWDLTPLPVSADLLVYTQAEWDSLVASNTRFARMLAAEVLWVLDCA
jgi:hypothetical protein